jgi:hypothetical protein
MINIIIWIRDTGCYSNAFISILGHEQPLRLQTSTNKEKKTILKET